MGTNALESRKQVQKTLLTFILKNNEDNEDKNPALGVGNKTI